VLYYCFARPVDHLFGLGISLNRIEDLVLKRVLADLSVVWYVYPHVI
jgi:hypothetical protein